MSIFFFKIRTSDGGTITQQLNLYIMKSLSYFGVVFLLLTLFSSCKKEQVNNFPEQEIMCTTSYGDFVPCDELQTREDQYAQTGLQKEIGYDYIWSSCTFTSRTGEAQAGGMCTPENDGGCTDEHACLPCGNC